MRIAIDRNKQTYQYTAYQYTAGLISHGSVAPKIIIVYTFCGQPKLKYVCKYSFCMHVAPAGAVIKLQRQQRLRIAMDRK